MDMQNEPAGSYFDSPYPAQATSMSQARGTDIPPAGQGYQRHRKQEARESDAISRNQWEIDREEVDSAGRYAERLAPTRSEPRGGGSLDPHRGGGETGNSPNRKRIQALGALFKSLDHQRTGVANTHDLLSAIKTDREVQALLGLPPSFSKGHPEYASFERVFQRIEADIRENRNMMAWTEFEAATAEIHHHHPMHSPPPMATSQTRASRGLETGSGLEEARRAVERSSVTLEMMAHGAERQRAQAEHYKLCAELAEKEAESIDARDKAPFREQQLAPIVTDLLKAKGGGYSPLDRAKDSQSGLQSPKSMSHMTPEMARGRQQIPPPSKEPSQIREFLSNSKSQLRERADSLAGKRETGPSVSSVDDLIHEAEENLSPSEIDELHKWIVRENAQARDALNIKRKSLTREEVNWAKEVFNLLDVDSSGMLDNTEMEMIHTSEGLGRDVFHFKVLQPIAASHCGIEDFVAWLEFVKATQGQRCPGTNISLIDTTLAQIKKALDSPELLRSIGSVRNILHIYPSRRNKLHIKGYRKGLPAAFKPKGKVRNMKEATPGKASNIEIKNKIPSLIKTPLSTPATQTVGTPTAMPGLELDVKLRHTSDVTISEAASELEAMHAELRDLKQGYNYLDDSLHREKDARLHALNMSPDNMNDLGATGADIRELQRDLVESRAEALAASQELAFQYDQAEAMSARLAVTEQSLVSLTAKTDLLDSNRHAFKCLAAACLVILEADTRLQGLWTVKHWAQHVAYMKRCRWAVRVVSSRRARWGFLRWFDHAGEMIRERYRRLMVLERRAKLVCLDWGMGEWLKATYYSQTARMAAQSLREWREGIHAYRNALGLLKEGRFKTRIRLMSKGFRRWFTTRETAGQRQVEEEKARLEALVVGLGAQHDVMKAEMYHVQSDAGGTMHELRDRLKHMKALLSDNAMRGVGHDIRDRLEKELTMMATRLGLAERNALAQANLEINGGNLRSPASKQFEMDEAVAVMSTRDVRRPTRSLSPERSVQRGGSDVGAVRASLAAALGRARRDVEDDIMEREREDLDAEEAEAMLRDSILSGVLKGGDDEDRFDSDSIYHSQPNSSTKAVQKARVPPAPSPIRNTKFAAPFWDSHSSTSSRGAGRGNAQRTTSTRSRSTSSRRPGSESPPRNGAVRASLADALGRARDHDALEERRASSGGVRSRPPVTGVTSFDALDINGDGVIDREEFDAYQSRARATALGKNGGQASNGRRSQPLQRSKPGFSRSILSKHNLRSFEGIQ